MKKIIFLLPVILLAGFLTIPVQASSGFINPTSKLFFIQPALESINLFFNFSKESKINYLIKLTARRTEEMNIAPSEAVANRYVNHFQELEKITKKISQEKQKQITEKIKETNLSQQEILARVYSQVPEPAQQVIMNAQINSSNEVIKIVETVQGQKMAQEYMVRAKQIIQIEKMKKYQQIQQTPMEGSPLTNPAESVPRALNEERPLNPELESKPLYPLLESGEQNVGSNQVQPVAPAPKQPLIQQK